MTESLAEKIAERIRAEGPLTVAAYMAMALYDPVGGYYARRAAIGGAGDFTTAPEISQIFGELIGLWCAELWQRMGRPGRFILAELGPGRGVLMSDFLRAAAGLPEFRRALCLYLVEASPVLRAEQERRLSEAKPVWVSRVEDLPDGPTLLIGNEFLDALPVRQFVRGRRHWSERLIALGPGGELVFVAGRENPAASLLVPASLRDSAPGALVEICPAALALAGLIGARFAHQPGAALFIDYGDYQGTPGESLRAVSGHRPVSPLAAPGLADLSAHVDFTAFAQAARHAGARICGPVPQGRFLEALGAGLRLAVLSEGAMPGQRRALESGVSRLLDPGQMGDLFKAIALISPWLPLPAGFEAA